MLKKDAKLVKFNYTTIDYEPLLPVTWLRGLVRGYPCFNKSIKSKLQKKIFANLITSAIQTRIVLIDCYRPTTTTTTYTTRTTTTTNATTAASNVDMAMKEWAEDKQNQELEQALNEGKSFAKALAKAASTRKTSYSQNQLLEKAATREASYSQNQQLTKAATREASY
jgi:hypothetical protein